MRTPAQEIRFGEIAAADDVVEHIAQSEEVDHRVDSDDLPAAFVKEHDRGRVEDPQFLGPFPCGGLLAIRFDHRGV